MPTLILTPRYTDDAQMLWRAAGRLGWGVERLHGWRVTEELRHSIVEPVPYIEALVAPFVAEQFGLRLDEPPLDWLPRLPAEYRKRDVTLSTLRSARLDDAVQFVKPPNDKSFPARACRGVDLPADLPDDTPVLVSEVVQWSVEFRCFILNRTVRAFSVYLRDGILQRDRDFESSDAEDAELLAFASTVLADPRVPLPRATVIDFGVIRDRGWAVIEQNAAWGSGIYGCDPEQVLHVLQHAVSRA